MEFQNKDSANSHIEQLKTIGRRNILLNDDNTNFSKNNRFNSISFFIDNGFMIPCDNFGQIMPISELESLIGFLMYTVENYDEKKSIEEEIKKTYSFIEKKAEKIESVKKVSIGYIYLIIGENKRYKIGFSKNPNRRLSELRLSSCENHTLIHKYKISNPSIEENRLHEKFADKRTHSEWFELSEEDVNYIKGLRDEI